MPLPDKLDLYFDGSCGPKNPGGTAGYAWQVVEPSTGHVLAQGYGNECSGPTATNNIGEWAALKKGLLYLVVEEGWKGQLVIRGDSQLVIYQLSGRYKCRKDTLIPYYERCILLLREVAGWEAHWIPREQNEDCDRMSKRAYASSNSARDAAAIRPVPGEHGLDVGSPRIHEGGPGITRMFGEETPEVSLN